MGHAAQRWARRRGVPVVCSHHTRFERYLGYYGLQLLAPLYWFGMRRFHRHCAATLPPSASLAAVLIAHGVPRVGVDVSGIALRSRSLLAAVDYRHGEVGDWGLRPSSGL